MKEIFGIRSYGEVHILDHKRFDKLPPLRASILKWEFIVKNAHAVHNDGGRTTCALCLRFHAEGCRKCPVRKRTGKDCCEGTPYFKFAHAKTDKEAVKVAQAEVRFLKSLLRKRRKP